MPPKKVRLFCSFVRQGKCPAPWLHVLLHRKTATPRSKRTLLSSDQAEVPARGQAEEHLQEEGGSDQVRRGLHKDHCIFGETAGKAGGKKEGAAEEQDL